MNDLPGYIEYVKGINIGGVIYAAVNNTITDETFALVVLHYMDKGWFCYKIQTETSIPYDTQCPNNILDLLSPTTDPDTLYWRQKCRDYNASGVHNLQLQDRIRTDGAYRVKHYDQEYLYDTFEFVKYYTFWALDNNGARLTRVTFPKQWKQKIKARKIGA